MYHYVRENSVDFPFSAHKTIDDFVSEIKSLRSLIFFGNLVKHVNCKVHGIIPNLIV